MKEMNIVFSTNNKFAYGLCIAIYSLLENNQKRKLNIYILHGGLSANNLNKLEGLGVYYKNVRIKPVKVDNKLFENFPLLEWWSVETYYRYILANILPKAEKVLYIDVDTLVLGDIYDLYNTNLDKYYIAGVNPEWKAKNTLYADHMKNIGIGKDDLYINAGVTLMNLKRIREDDKVSELFENTKKYTAILKMLDQDVINMTFKGAIKEVDAKYNFRMPAMIQKPEQLATAKILHFTESTKPWDSYRYEARAFFGEWYRYEHGYHTLVGTISKNLYRGRLDVLKQSSTQENDELKQQVRMLTQEVNTRQRSSGTLKSRVKKSVKRVIKSGTQKYKR